jgi:hypothetical protein
MDEQPADQTSTDPSTTSVPPVEGCADIGEEQATTQQASEEQVANSATTITKPESMSKSPAEGREDVAEDLVQEQQQAYSASEGQMSNPQQHTQHIAQLLRQGQNECRSSVVQIHDARAQALLETIAEVLGGAIKAHDDYQQKNEPAWQANQTTTADHNVVPTTPRRMMLNIRGQLKRAKKLVPGRRKTAS